MVSPIVIILVSSLLLSVHAKSSEEKYPMYEADAIDVLRKMVNEGAYEKVFIQYHGCAWSEYGNGDGENACGEEDEDNWYMGKTQCYRANIAYSLYGLPTGEDTPKRPCQALTFINSFFTTQGVDNFANTLGVFNAGEASSQCVIFSQGDDDFYDNHDINYGHNEKIHPNYSSYTTSCAADGSFQQTLFGGAFCSGRENMNVLDTMDQFNSVMSNLDCVAIYDVNEEDAEEEEAQDQGDDQANNGGRHLEQDAASEGLYGLLTYSTACSALEYPMTCPDPFGAKGVFEYKPDSEQPWWKKMGWMDWTGFAFLFLALLLFLFPLCAIEDDEDEDEESPKHDNNKRGRKDSDRRRRTCGRRVGSRWGATKRWFRKRILRRRN